MKKLYTFIVIMLFALNSTAQIVNIPDANFKAILLAASPSNTIAEDAGNNNIKIDINNDGEIQESEALNVFHLRVSNAGIQNMTGIESFLNLITFIFNTNQITSLDLSQNVALVNIYCASNQLTSLDLSQNVALEYLYCFNNQLPSLDVSQNLALIYIYCTNNQLTSLDFSQNAALGFISCANNQLTSLDVTQNSTLYYLDCNNNALTSLFLKNNNFCWCNLGEVNGNLLNFSNNPDIEYICGDEEDMTMLQQKITNYGYTNCHVNSYCSFVPGGDFYIIQGNTRLDSNTNGCDAMDLNIPNQKYLINGNGVSGTLIADQSGDYELPVIAGTHNIIPTMEIPDYFTVSPTSLSVTFPAATSPFVQNFCVTPNGIKNDVEITIIPIDAARPGFDANYKIIYKNKGNQMSNGTLSLSFDEAVMDLVSAMPINTSAAVNSLSWNYTNLNPFETRAIDVVFNINSPMEMPAVNGGDVLSYTVTIVGATDETPLDNTMTLNQIVVNSFDPNDKTCLEGNTITPSMVGQYVHYVIRFENTGTFPAQNVVVTDAIDVTKFDVTSLVPQSSSHSFVTRINNGKVEFIFEDINLPFDDANNDGYVAFKIKTKPTLVVGNTFTNNASIYFDFNFPIITNTTSTTVALLGAQDFAFEKYFSLYPNPTKDVLNIKTKETIGLKSVAIYNTLGQMVLAFTNAENISLLDVSQLKTGSYFIKLITDKGSTSQQFIKE